MTTSLPARGAWIEIGIIKHSTIASACRSPHGERGLKSVASGAVVGLGASLPARGAWIEIQRTARSRADARLVAPRTGSVD